MNHARVGQLVESLTGHTAVTDGSGDVVLVNGPWRRFARENAGNESSYYVGTNYRRVCRAASADGVADARLMLDGLDDVLGGSRASFAMEYSCHSPSERRWFIVYVRRFQHAGAPYLTVVHQNITVTHALDGLDQRGDASATPGAILDAGTSASSGLFAGIIRAASDAIIAVDDRGYIALFNPAAERMLRCAASQALGGSLDRFIPARYRDEHARHVAAFAASGVSARHMGRQAEITAVRADGEEFPAEATICQVPSAQPRLLAVILRDVTERKLIERSLSNSVERYHRLIAVIPDAVCIECHGRIQLVNPACVALFGASSAAALLGGTLTAHFGAEDAPQLRRLHEAVTSDPTLTLQMEARLLHADGSTSALDVSVAAFEHGGLCCVLTILRDVSARKAAEDAMMASREQMRGLATALRAAREEEQTRIARDLHDELGQLLSLLKLRILRLGSQIGHEDPESMRAIEDAVAVVDETIRSVRRIATELRPVMLDYLGLLPTIAWLADEFADRSGIEVRLKLPEAVPIHDRDIATTWFRILQEALTNVLRHAGATAVGIRVFEADGAIRMTISDNGSGFDVAAARGKGFGLLGMQERAAEIGATLTLESEPGVGSRLELALPLPGA